ncbi:MAG: radical SAM protein [Thermoleophilia bacterium]|nr:radical SAM protein [Thermoleophilia bacterium]
MATFSASFLGCKVSHADVQEVRERLLADGHVEADGAEVAVIGTCCVTREAVAKSRKAARRVAGSARRVYLTGCAASLPGALDGLPGNVETVALPSEQTPGFVAGRLGALACATADAGLDRVRAFVKVQDGCGFACSFCVIPAVRGGPRSRPVARVLAEIRRRAEQGHREVVLTGINLGCYRDREAGLDLPGLVRAAGAVPGLARLRLSSVEVNHVTPALLAALRETEPASPHLHVPLQSGDDGVLRAMRRRYTAASFLRRLERAEGFNLTTDVIVGFPGEDDAAFERTLAVIERAGVTRAHVFPYSPRPGTAAAALDPVAVAVKRERSSRLRAAVREARLRAWARKVGSDDTVLVDRPGRGYGDDYSPWLVEGRPVGALVAVRGRAVSEEGILAA